MKHRKEAFTLIELLVVISIIALLIGILLPVLASARNAALQGKNTTRVRGIQQGCHQYSQSNNGKYPGLDNDESTYADYYNASRRFQLLLDGNFVTADYLVSPVEQQKQPNSQLAASPTPTDHFSYVMLKIGPRDISGGIWHFGRRAEWSSNVNSQAVMIYDRNTATGTGSDARSIHSDRDWRGSVAFGDGHAQFESDNVLDKETSYSAHTNAQGTDDLFVDESGVTGNMPLGNNAFDDYN